MFAMKVLRKDKIKMDNKVENIMTERRILEMVNHPFIIKMHSAFQSVRLIGLNSLYIEALSAYSIRVLCRRRTVLPTLKAKKIPRTDCQVLLLRDPTWH